MLRRYRYVVGWEGKAIDLELHVRNPPGSSRAVCMYVVRLCAIDKITPARSGLVLAPRPLSLQPPGLFLSLAVSVSVHPPHRALWGFTPEDAFFSTLFLSSSEYDRLDRNEPLYTHGE